MYRPEQRQISFECTRCGTCCRHRDLIVTVTATDIDRLSTGLGLDSSMLLRALDFYVLSEGMSPPIGLRHIPQVLTESGPAYVALRKLPSGECVFLQGDLCMIYDLRPDACRIFPFVFDTDRYQEDGLNPLYALCPGLGRGPAMDLSDVVPIVTESLVNFREYCALVRQWNEAEISHTASGFIKFVLSARVFPEQQP
ncbi:MAG: YkgJ family cysteine cluster protein [Candidatus Thorarchaeota archaeon]